MNHAMRATLLMIVALVSIATLLPATAQAQRTNNTTGCSGNTVNYNPANGEDIVVPKGFKVERFSKQDLNFPTGIAFLGSKSDFKVLVLESGHGLPSRCNDRTDPVYGGPFSPRSPGHSPSPRGQATVFKPTVPRSTSASKTGRRAVACSRPTPTRASARLGSTTALVS